MRAFPRQRGTKAQSVQGTHWSANSVSSGKMCLVWALVQTMTCLARIVPLAWQSASHPPPTAAWRSSLTGVHEKKEKADEADASASRTSCVASLCGWTEPA